MSDAEHRLQCACVRWFNYMFPDKRGLLFAVPNGGRRDAQTGARLKAEGVVAGVADLILLCPTPAAPALMIEMKTPKGHQSPEQKTWETTVTAAGYRYVVVRSFEEFTATVADYLGSDIN